MQCHLSWTSAGGSAEGLHNGLVGGAGGVCVCVCVCGGGEGQAAGKEWMERLSPGKNRRILIYFVSLSLFCKAYSLSPFCVLCVLFTPAEKFRFELKMKKGGSADFRQEFSHGQVCTRCSLFHTVDLTVNGAVCFVQ